MTLMNYISRVTLVLVTCIATSCSTPPAGDMREEAAVVLLPEAPDAISQPGSTEYKLLLNAKAFSDINAGTNAFFKVVAAEASQLGLELKNHSEPQKRSVAFWDTKDKTLFKKTDYILRTRDTEKGSGYTTKITLKQRSKSALPTRSIVLDTTASKPKRKYEVDITPSNIPKYSRSISLKKKKKKKAFDLSTADDVYTLFPNLKDAFGGKKRSLVIVNDIKIDERVMESELQSLANDQNTSKASLTLWYMYGENNPSQPILAEFSFKYKDNEDSVTQSTLKALFTKLQKSDWVTITGTTKTNWVYGKK